MLCVVLAPSALHLFDLLVKHPGGHRCQTDAEVQEAVSIHKAKNSMQKACILFYLYSCKCTEKDCVLLHYTMLAQARSAVLAGFFF